MRARFVGIVTALLWASASGAIGQQPDPPGPSEKVVWAMNASQSKGGWKFGFEHEIPHRYSIYELIHKDDDINNWRELITVESFPRPKRLTAEDVFNRVKTGYEKLCATGTMRWTIIDKSAVSVVYGHTRTQTCRGFAPERELGKVVFGKIDCFWVRYDAKGTVWEPGQREEWLKSISDAKVVLVPVRER